jgi:hypothetical protein
MDAKHTDFLSQGTKKFQLLGWLKQWKLLEIDAIVYVIGKSSQT